MYRCELKLLGKVEFELLSVIATNFFSLIEIEQLTVFEIKLSVVDELEPFKNFAGDPQGKWLKDT